jgi:hypothetical protein
MATVSGTVQPDWLGTILTVVIVLGILFIIYSKVTGNTLGDLVDSIKSAFKGGE